MINSSPIDVWLSRSTDGARRSANIYVSSGRTRVRLYEGPREVGCGYGDSIEEACANALNDIMGRLGADDEENELTHRLAQVAIDSGAEACSLLVHRCFLDPASWDERLCLVVALLREQGRDDVASKVSERRWAGDGIAVAS